MRKYGKYIVIFSAHLITILKALASRYFHVTTKIILFSNKPFPLLPLTFVNPTYFESTVSS
jgi:hypothetical protein